MQELQQQDPVQQELRAWFAEEPQRVRFYGPVTGNRIVDLDPEEVERLRQEIPGDMVVANQPISVIHPRQTAGRKVSLEEDDYWHLRAIGLEAARSNGFQGSGRDVRVLVLDTGIDESHPELQGKIEQAWFFDPETLQIRAITSYDSDGHGTHVTGLICGDTVGVAPGARIWNGLMLPRRRGTIASFVTALEWAAQHAEVQIVNISAGIHGYVDDLHDSIATLLSVGVLVVCATGNEGVNQTRSPGNYVEVLSVGATTRQGRVASFSSSGTLVVNNHQYSVPDVVAPGAGVFSSVIGGGYEAWDGTSMATGIVSGLAALILERYPAIRVPDLLDTIMSTSLELEQVAVRQGYGLVQVVAAL
ncbi:MAG: S8 family serine peptidase [Oscillochloridaceae bacterium]|nr:S8 family serine peptidase [Chloroflexaceae bacterium]MDW8392355.1 S8 family serine peptidase [Oscillochloridaceae bacterium]